MRAAAAVFAAACVAVGMFLVSKEGEKRGYARGVDDGWRRGYTCLSTPPAGPLPEYPALRDTVAAAHSGPWTTLRTPPQDSLSYQSSNKITGPPGPIKLLVPLDDYADYWIIERTRWGYEARPYKKGTP